MQTHGAFILVVPMLFFCFDMFAKRVLILPRVFGTTHEQHVENANRVGEKARTPFSSWFSSTPDIPRAG